LLAGTTRRRSGSYTALPELQGEIEGLLRANKKAGERKRKQTGPEQLGPGEANRPTEQEDRETPYRSRSKGRDGGIAEWTGPT